MRFTKRVRRELLLEVLLFCFGMLFISLFYLDNILLTLLLIMGWSVGIKFWHRKDDFYFFLSGAVVGPIGEIVCIHFGAWKYTNPSFLGIPIWLPFAWGLAMMLIKRVAETFLKVK